MRGNLIGAAVLLLAVTLPVSAVSCVRGGAGIDRHDNTTSTNATSANVVSTNTSPLPTSQINPSLLNHLWTNANVFVDETKTINVEVGERFIIRYDYYHNMFARFEETDDPKDIVYFSGQTSNISGAQPVDGVIWFFFQGIKAGTTNVTITEFTHGPVSIPQSQKTFLVNVGNQNPVTVPPPAIVPGRWIFNSARVLYAHSITLKAGETKSIDVTLETRRDGPGEFSGIIFSTDKEYGYYTLPMPSGLEISLEPQKVMASPNNTYHLSIIIKTSAGLPLGGYWLRFEHNFENVFRGSGWIVVGVE